MDRNIRRIAFSGSIGCGKTTIAKLFSERLGYFKLSFADEIREEASAIHGIPIELFSGSEKENYRQMLIDIGESERELDKDHWVKPLLKKVRKMKDKRVVIDDVRFSHEAKRLRTRYNFVVIRLESSYERTLDYLTRIRGLSEEQAEQRLHDAPESSFSSHDADFSVPVQKTDIETYRRVINVMLDIQSLAGLKVEW